MSAQPQITLHHLNESRSDRIFWVLEELGLPYNVKVHWRNQFRGAPPELKQVSPYGKAPAVELDGKLLTESGFIIHHLLTTYGTKGKKDIESPAGADSSFWNHFAEGTMMCFFQGSAAVAATAKLYTSGAVPATKEMSEEAKGAVGQYAKFVQENLFKPQSQTHLDEIEKYLSSHPGKYFSGTDQPGEGDFNMFFPINSLLTGSRINAGFTVGEATRDWHKMVMDRPAAQKAMARLKSEEEAQRAKM